MSLNSYFYFSAIIIMQKVVIKHDNEHHKDYVSYEQNQEELEKLPPLFSEQIIQNMKYLKEAQESLFEYETNKKMSKELYLKIKELLVIIRKT